MKVVLLQNVEKLGRKGDVVSVTSGYGVNFLVPKGLAAPATEDAVRQAKIASQSKKVKQEELGALVERLIKKISRKSFQIKTKASKTGRMYGSLTRNDVSASLTRQWELPGKGVEVKADLAQPIRETGKYPIDVIITENDREHRAEVVLTVVGE